MAVFKRWRLALVIWLGLAAGSFYIYQRVIDKDGFPDLSPPIIQVSGNYFVGDQRLIDRTVSRPLQKILPQADDVAYVQTVSYPNGFSAVVGFELETDDQGNKKQIENLISRNRQLLPDGLEIKVELPQATRYLRKYDLLIAVYDRQRAHDLYQTQLAARQVADLLEEEPYLRAAEVVPLIAEDRAGGRQRVSFNHFAAADSGRGVEFYEAVHLGLAADGEEVDTLALSQNVRESLAGLDFSGLEGDFQVRVVEDFATAINRNLDSLENNLLTGLLVIGLLSLFLISWRASLIIVLFMVSVLGATILALYLIGYSLNIITLFALILALGLLVDDAVIMVEALDVYKQKKLPDKTVIRNALNRILLASLAGTLTTTLVFIPLAFVEGLLGEFIRFIPLTLVLILLASFLFSITLIPALARLTILRERKKDYFKRFNPFLKMEKILAKGWPACPCS